MKNNIPSQNPPIKRKQKRNRAIHSSVPFDGQHELEGIFIANGPNIKAGQYQSLSLYDIAPTALYLLQLGVPSSLPGNIALDCITEQFKIQYPPITVAKKKLSSEPYKPSLNHLPNHYENKEHDAQQLSWNRSEADAKKKAFVMHPGPMNRGVEIDSYVADSDQSIILNQVLNGVAVRMSILYLLLGANVNEENY